MNDPDISGSQLSHADVVDGEAAFAVARTSWRASLANDDALRRDAVELQRLAEGHRYTYTWEWLGVPIIRLPDDFVVLQEIFWAYKPERVLETGVARGGSMLLNASLMRLCGLDPAVLGIDITIFPHTRTAMTGHPLAMGVALLEADSTSDVAAAAADAFLEGAKTAILVLDSNHTHAHVLAELRVLAPLLPIGGIVLVADTLIEEFPAGHFSNRPWDRGNNPATATRAFLAENADFRIADDWARRALVTEFRDGILRRIS